MPALLDYARHLPKAELHLHIEGTLEPEMMFALAARNGIALPYASVEEVRAAYHFSDLQSFLDLYYAGASVLITEQDFTALADAYFAHAAADGVVHAELFFDPQTHTARGVSMHTVIHGLVHACENAEKNYGISSQLILCFLRHLSQQDAFDTLAAALPYREYFIGVGLDSGECGNPPEKFAEVFAQCRALGLRVVAHAGEEGPAAYIRAAIDILNVERIDHGVRCSDDPALVAQLAASQMPLTVCPLSNIKLCVFTEMREHNLKQLLDAGLRVTINSDDPAYFGGYVLANYAACIDALQLNANDVRTLARNSISASWMPEEKRARYLTAIDTTVVNA